MLSKISTSLRATTNWLKRHFWLPLLAAFALLFVVTVPKRKRAEQKAIDAHLSKIKRRDDTLRVRIESVDAQLEENKQRIDAVTERTSQHPPTSSEISSRLNRVL